MTFAEFFEQSSEQFKKDWLKPGKYALYKSGKYPITAFIPPHPDRAFGVKQLKEMDIESFKGVKWVKDKLNSFIKKDNLSFDLKDLQQIEDQAKKIVGTEEISFKGISDVSILNRINRVLHEIKQKYPYFYLYSIETVDNLIDNVPAAINGFNQMFLNAPYINHMLENYKQFQVVEGKYINPAGAMYYNKEIETIIYHEAGHAIYNIKVNDPKGYDKTNSNSKIKRHKLAVLKQMYRKSKQNGYAETVSKYAPVSEREFFSEIFAAVNLDKNAIPDYIKEGIKEILR